jgi:hypothetical protein
MSVKLLRIVGTSEGKEVLGLATLALGLIRVGTLTLKKEF